MVDSYQSALCQTLYDGVEQEDWVTMYNVLREAANKVCIKKVGEGTGLLWKLSEEKGEGKTYYDEDRKSGRICGKYGQWAMP